MLHDTYIHTCIHAYVHTSRKYQRSQAQRFSRWRQRESPADHRKLARQGERPERRTVSIHTYDAVCMVVCTSDGFSHENVCMNWKKQSMDDYICRTEFLVIFYASMHAYLYVCIYAGMSVMICMHADVGMLHSARTCVRMLVCTYVGMRNVHVHTYIQTCIHVSRYTYFPDESDCLLSVFLVCLSIQG